MPLKLVPTSQFKKDLKRIRKRGYDLDALEIVSYVHVNRLKIEITTMPYRVITLDFANAVSNPIGCLYMQSMVIS